MLSRRNRTISQTLDATCPDPVQRDAIARCGPITVWAHSEVLKLTHREWIKHHLNLLVLGPTPAGKSYLASALGRAACQVEYTVRYERTSCLLQTLELARADGSYAQLLQKLARIHLLILDDWLRDPLSRSQARDLLEILDDRYGRNATMVVTQIPVAQWHERIPDPTLGDAILDRLIHSAYRLELEGESMRKLHFPLVVDHDQ